MKKQLALAVGLAVLAAPAFASKARLAALGEDVNGSFYINDNRNIFLNASEVLNHKDMVTYELQDNGSGNGEGGFLRAHGNMVYGVQLGRNLSFNEDADELGQAAGLDAGEAFAASNAIDLFVGGDAGIKWGAQLTYASSKDDAYDNGANTNGTDKAEADVIDLRVGVAQNNWAAYVAYGVSGKSEIKEVDGEISRKTPIEVGGSYKWDAYTAFAQYSTVKYDVEDATIDESAEATSYQVGLGRQDKLNDKATLFTKVSYTNSKEDAEDVGGSDEESKAIPVVIGLEYDAASWLALRGSVAQNVIINEEEVDGDKSTPQSTAVAAGATLKFGDLAVDGVVGNNNAGTAGVVDSSNFMTRVSLTYKF